MQNIKAIVYEGHRVASGESTEDRRFPLGTIRMQAPFFKEAGLDFDAFFDGDFVFGTLNLLIAPHKYKIAKPKYFLPKIKWTDIFPAENFYLNPAEIQHLGKSFKALLYIPDPATKPDHFQGDSIIEVIAQRIEGISYGDEVVLAFPPEAIEIMSK